MAGCGGWVVELEVCECVGVGWFGVVGVGGVGVGERGGEVGVSVRNNYLRPRLVVWSLSRVQFPALRGILVTSSLYSF